MVFSLWSDDHNATEVDIFVQEPLNFQEAYKRKKDFSLSTKTKACILSLDDLLKLKKEAGTSDKH